MSGINAEKNANDWNLICHSEAVFKGELFKVRRQAKVEFTYPKPFISRAAHMESGRVPPAALALF